MAKALLIAFALLVTACSSRSEQQRVDDYAALIEAAESGQVAKVEALLTRGTPVDAVKTVELGSPWAVFAQRPSPLFVAAANGHKEVVKSLLKHKPWLDWNCCDSFTPLGTAAANGHLEIVEALLAAGADPEIASSGGKTPLEAARAKGHAEIALLLERAIAARR